MIPAIPPVSAARGIVDRASAWLAAAAAFATYVATLHPSVPGGDAGELIAVAWTGGVAHPPGYPLFTLLARVFTLVPFGSPAWRVNLLSAACDAAAAGFVCAIVARWTGRAWGGIFAAGLFATSPLIWSYALGAEVFALNNLFGAALVYATLRWDEDRNSRWAAAAAGLFGLGLSNHHTLLLLGLPLAAWMLLSSSELRRPRALAILALCVLAGLVPYAYLPIAAATRPAIVWGDPTNLAGFVRHVLRAEYGTLRLGGELPAGSQFFAQLGLYGRSVAREMFWVGLPLALVGLVSAWRDPSRRGMARALAGGFVFYLFVFHFAANLPVAGALYREVTARFWQLPNLLLFVGAGVGLAAVAKRLGRPPSWGIAAVAVGTPLLSLAVSFQARDESGNRYVARYAEAILAPLPRNALLLTRGDLVTNGVRYLQACEGARPDVIVLDQELLTRPWYVASERRKHPDVAFPGTRYDPAAPGAFSIAQWIDANGATREIWVYPELNPADRSWAGRFELWPAGLPAKVVAAGASLPSEEWRRAGERSLADLRAGAWPPPARYPDGTWERVVLLDVLQASNRRAAWLLTRPQPWAFDAGVLTEARQLLESELLGHPSPGAAPFKNLGIAYERLAIRDPALLPKRDAAWREYLRLAPADDPDRRAVEAALATASR